MPVSSISGRYKFANFYCSNPITPSVGHQDDGIGAITSPSSAMCVGVAIT